MNASLSERAVGTSPPPAVVAGDVGAVSWGAIFAGGVAAAALSLTLLVLGVGLGFTAVSPWSQGGPGATGIGLSSALWLAVTALFASGIGGYIAGRLRTKWTATHVDEVHFRDTAHGFVAWSVATLVTAGVLTGSIGAIVGSGVQAGASLAGAAGTTAVATGRSAASGDSASQGLGYFTDSLFRSGTAAPAQEGSASTSAGEVTRIFVQGLRSGTLTPDDTRYVGQLVAQRTGLSQEDAEKRVGDTFTRAKAASDDAVNKAKEAADQARKAGAYAALWIVVSLLIGAFSASLAATIGGRQRDA